MDDYLCTIIKTNSGLSEVFLNFLNCKQPEKFVYHHYYYKMQPIHILKIIKCDNKNDMKKTLYNNLKPFKISENLYDLSGDDSYKMYENIVNKYKNENEIDFDKYLENNRVRRVSTWLKDNIEYCSNSELTLNNIISKYKNSEYYNSFRIKNIHPGIKFVFNINGIQNKSSNDTIYKNLKFKDF